MGGFGEISTSISTDLTTGFIRPLVSFQLIGETHEEFLFQVFSLEQMKCCLGRLLNGPSCTKSTIALASNVLHEKLKRVVPTLLL